MSVLAPEQFNGAVAPLIDARDGAIEEVRVSRRGFGLTSRLMVITIAAVIAVISIFGITRLSLSRENALRDRMFAARTAAMVFASDSPSPSKELSRKILDAVGAQRIVLTSPQGKIVIEDGASARPADYQFDNTDPSIIEGIKAAFDTLFAARGSTLMVVGPGPTPGSTIEMHARPVARH